MRTLTDWDRQIQAFDFETSGSQPEYALQPWRLSQGKFWATSLVWMRREPQMQVFGGLAPDRGMMREMLEEAVAKDLTMLGWFVIFDISVLLACGFHELVFKLNWLDGYLLWRHLEVEPEYEIARHKKKSFGLKRAVATYLPQFANYAEDVDFHDPSPEARAKLHRYNIRDVGFTWLIAKQMWEKLTERQRNCALIEADCLPMVAQANLEGMLVDGLAMAELSAALDATAARQLAKLAEHGVTETIVRSPKQLGELLYDQWGLPVLKINKSKLTGNETRSTDKEVLHELSFKDPRAKELRAYREALNNKTKFATAPLVAAYYNEDGCAHPLASVFGTYTSRMTYSSKQSRKDKQDEPREADE